jgi:hypothetical protein
MEAIDLPNWEAFEQKVKELRAEYAMESSPLLFRGQGNPEWPLTTTLERSGGGRMLFSEYYRLICASIGPEVETFAGFDVPEYIPSTDTFCDTELLWLQKWPTVPLYRYMAYLRHLGFPSPLLDWSQSPFVAAYFAFRDDPTSESLAKRRIYAYCERPRGAKGMTHGEPYIYPVGPYVQTHHRHFRQRSYYTICGSFDTAYKQWRFDSHQYAFDNAGHLGQDYLWKFDLPSRERPKVLSQLNDYNLNAFSLFGSEESLMETMWFREQVLRKHNSST